MGQRKQQIEPVAAGPQLCYLYMGRRARGGRTTCHCESATAWPATASSVASSSGISARSSQTCRHQRPGYISPLRSPDSAPMRRAAAASRAEPRRQRVSMHGVPACAQRRQRASAQRMRGCARRPHAQRASCGARIAAHWPQHARPPWSSPAGRPAAVAHEFPGEPYNHPQPHVTGGARQGPRTSMPAAARCPVSTSPAPLASSTKRTPPAASLPKRYSFGRLAPPARAAPHEARRTLVRSCEAGRPRRPPV